MPRRRWKAVGRRAKPHAEFGFGGATGSNRVNRGGAWNNDASNARAANRNNNDPANRNDNLSFRPVR